MTYLLRNAGSVQSLVEVAEGRESAMAGHGSLLVMLLSVSGTFAMVLLITWHARASIDEAQAKSQQGHFMQHGDDSEAGPASTTDVEMEHSTSMGEPAA